MPPIKGTYVCSDDLVLPGLFGAVFHGAWTILLGIVFSKHWHDPNTGRLLYRITLCLFLSTGLLSLLELIVAIIASRGLIYQLSSRRLVVPMLVPLLLAFLFQIGSNAAAVRLVYLDQGGKPLMAVTIALWISTGFLCWNLWLSLNTHGLITDPHLRWQKRMKAAKKIMKCTAPSADEDAVEGPDQEGARWLLRLAEIFAAVMRFDLVASDIFFGTVLTSARQAMDARQLSKTEEGEVEAGKRARETPPRELLEEALYYLPFASAVYGIPMWLWMELRIGKGFWAGIGKLICCCFVRVKEPETEDATERLRRSQTVKSLPKKASSARIAWRRRAISLLCDIPTSHVLYQNLDNYALGSLPFIIVKDAKRNALVVGIRGTMSGSDVATDLLCDACPLTDVFDEELCRTVLGREPEAAQDYAHMGMLKASKHIVDELLKLGVPDGVLGRVKGDPGADKLQLVICGHSLGAGAAGLVGLMMSAFVPDLRVWSFEPPGALVSPAVLEVSRRFTTCLVHHEDIICRLNVHNVNEVCEEVVKSLALCRRSKFQLTLLKWFGSSWSDMPRERLFFKESEVPEECARLRDRMLQGAGDEPEPTPFTSIADLPAPMADRSAHVVKGDGFHRLTAPPLYIPGRAIHVQPDDTLRRRQTFKPTSKIAALGGVGEDDTPVVAEFREPQYFAELGIRLSGNCFFDHLPDTCIEAVRKSIR